MAYKQRWLEYFEVLDVSHNGFIDPGDIAFCKPACAKLLNKPEDSPEVIAASNGLSTIMRNIIKDFDKNKDGKVAKDELLAGVEKYFIGKSQDSLPDWWKEQIKTCFDSADKDKNGSLTLAEFAFLRFFNPQVTDAELKQAYDWGASKRPSGRFDDKSLGDAFYTWATSPDPFPEGRTILPFFYKI